MEIQLHPSFTIGADAADGVFPYFLAGGRRGGGNRLQVSGDREQTAVGRRRGREQVSGYRGQEEVGD